MLAAAAFEGGRRGEGLWETVREVALWLWEVALDMDGRREAREDGWARLEAWEGGYRG
jgi:hypothetical protein